MMPFSFMQRKHSYDRTGRRFNMRNIKAIQTFKSLFNNLSLLSDTGQGPPDTCLSS